MTPKARAAFLDTLRGEDSEVADEVESLLDHEAAQTIDLVSAGDRQPDDHPELDESLLDRRIGKYHTRRVIAVGGMGVVFEAMQDSPRRVVALKLLKPGLMSRSARKRFEYEGQTLGRLRHPGVAQIYELGVHQINGVESPFIAMEYIPGAQTITEYAAAHDLSVHDRLSLFLQACDAVQHGHAKGIIHRDLKPANILADAHGACRIIDFGVARATDSDLALTSLQTNVGELIGTVQYMSPEQFVGDPHDLDVRSDVYSLGVVLYELLSGEVPYDLSSTPLPQAARVVTESVPRRLSTIRRSLGGDLERIVAKAIDKTRSQRYQSVVELAADIRRYLCGEPIEASSPSMWLLATRWMGRHPLATTVSCAVGLALLILGSTLVAVWWGRFRPSDFRIMAEARSAHLVSPFGKELATLGGETCRPGNVSAVFADRPSRFGGGKVAVFSVIEGEHATGEQLWVCDPASLDEPLWQTRSDRPFEQPAWPPGWVSDASIDRFVVNDFLVANVFEEAPGDEIIAIHAHATTSPHLIRVYDFSGAILFEAWHFGLIKQPFWWEEAGLLVCIGDRHGRVDIAQHGYPVAPPWPRVVFAIKPQRGLRVGWLNQVHWPAEWRDDSQVEATMAWYKTLVPVEWAGLFHVSGVTDPRDSREDHRYVLVNFTSDIHGDFEFQLDAQGQVLGRTDNDAFVLARGTLPAAEPSLGDWPPSSDE